MGRNCSLGYGGCKQEECAGFQIPNIPQTHAVTSSSPRPLAEKCRVLLKLRSNLRGRKGMADGCCPFNIARPSSNQLANVNHSGHIFFGERKVWVGAFCLLHKKLHGVINKGLGGGNGHIWPL